MVVSIAAACRPVPAARTSLLVETKSLFLMTGNLPLPLWKGSGILDLIRPGESDFGRSPCTFPAHQGFAPRDEFEPDGDCGFQGAEAPPPAFVSVDLGVHDSDRAVHDDRSRRVQHPTGRVFTITDLAVHDGPKRAILDIRVI